MRYFKNLLFVLSLLISCTTVGAQEEIPRYTVQVGSFVNPKLPDFAAAGSLGFVFGKARATNTTDVFVGGFTTQTEAEKVAGKLKEKGYDNAFVADLNTDGGQSVSIIQLATKKVGDKMNWENWLKAGNLYVLLNGSQVKIFTGIYPDIASAKADLTRLKELGFKDAFAKNANNALLHEIKEFELGGAAKKPLIPLNLAEKQAEESKKAETPKEYAEETLLADAAKTIPKSETPVIGKNDLPKQESKTTPKEPVVKEKETPKPAEKEAVVLTAKEGVDLMPQTSAPSIRATVKRTSALELQKTLKAEGAYKGSLDGFYGKGTKISYEQAVLANRQFQKYKILSKHTAKPDNIAPKGSVQFFINSLWDDPKTSLDGLEASKAPVAKAYRAYFLFVSDGAGEDVNRLMNEAIKAAFMDKKAVNLPKFDYSATYAYFDVEQLLLHLRYIHQVSPDKPEAPCWLFRKHPGPALKAFESKGEGNDFRLQACGGFWEWEEVQILDVIAQDICAQSDMSEAKIAESKAKLAQLYLTPNALSDEERKTLEAWNSNLWKSIEGWASRDPMLGETATALRLSYFQTQVLLEDFFMDEGFNEKEAKGLALSALKSLVGHHLDRFF